MIEEEYWLDDDEVLLILEALLVYFGEHSKTLENNISKQAIKFSIVEKFSNVRSKQ